MSFLVERSLAIFAQGTWYALFVPRDMFGGVVGSNPGSTRRILIACIAIARFHSCPSKARGSPSFYFNKSFHRHLVVSSGREAWLIHLVNLAGTDTRHLGVAPTLPDVGSIVRLGTTTANNGDEPAEEGPNTKGKAWKQWQQRKDAKKGFDQSRRCGKCPC